MSDVCKLALMTTKSIFLALGIAFAPIAVLAADTPQQIVLHKAVDRLLPSNALNVVTFSAPRAISVRELGLDSAGLRAGPAIVKADEIRIFTNRNVMEASPKVRLWLNEREGNRWWYQTGGQGNAEDHVIEPGEVVVIVTHASTNELPWVNPLAD